MSQIVAIQRKSKKNAPMIPLEDAILVAGIGVKGGRNGRPGGKRQVLIVPIEVLEAFSLNVGDLREQITTRGFDAMALRVKDRIRIGDAILEATGECEPCEQIEAIRPGLQAALAHQRGMLFRVIEGGTIRVGDEISVVEREVVG
jgi:MOSC domain-containing protein YiiM